MRKLRVFVLTVVLFSNAIYAQFQIDVSDSPKSNLELTLGAIESAQESLLLNIYEFTSEPIAQALIKKIRQGIKVEILQEGEPVGNMSQKALDLQSEILAAMEAKSHAVTNRYFVMTSDANENGLRRFRFDHAKYLVVDGRSTVIGSENYSPTGHPLPGTKGTRGWETRLYDVPTTKEFIKMFRADAELSHGDVEQLVEGGRVSFLPGMAMVQGMSELSSVQSYWDGAPLSLVGESIERVTSPESSLTGLIKLMRSARRSLDLELMGFSMKWGNTGRVSPLYQEVVAAARRGVAVRVLLNDEKAFIGGNHKGERAAKKNQSELTVDALNALATEEGLDLEAAIADVQGMGVKYIHNKGVLVDEDKVLISSINWNQNSVMNNRETAVVISSREINRFYRDLFTQDWEVSR